MTKVTKNDKTFKVSGSTHSIKQQLRAAVEAALNRPQSAALLPSLNRRVPVVVTNRATGKTTALVLFVGERTLVVPSDEAIAVMVPTKEIGLEFLNQFTYHFPTLTPPLVATPRAFRDFAGLKIKEVYIEEFFILSPEDLHFVCSSLPVAAAVVGVGTIEYPTTITISV